jgi:hypothetical protein
MAKQRSALIAVAALPVSAIAWFSAFLAPHPFAPASLAIVLPSFLLAGALGDDSFASGPYLLPAVAAGLYLLGSVPLLLGRSWTWRFLAFFFALLLFGNVVFFVFTWNQGVEFQGAAYTWIVLSLNVLCAVLAGAALFVAWRRATHASLVSVHIALFCWLS